MDRARCRCGAVQIESISSRVKSAWLQRLKLNYEAMRSSFALHLNLRPCSVGKYLGYHATEAGAAAAIDRYNKVGRCKLKPVLNHLSLMEGPRVVWAREQFTASA